MDNSSYWDLKKLSELKDNGVLTEQEYEIKKQQILSSNWNNQNRNNFEGNFVRPPKKNILF